MKNLDNEVWELLQDDQFIKWVHSPDAGSIAYWEEWMKQYPDKVTTLFKAREIARDLAYMEKPDGAEQLSATIWTGVLGQLGEETHRKISGKAIHGEEERAGARSGEAITLEVKTVRNRRTWYAIAACLAGLLLIGAVFFRYRSANRPAAVIGAQQVASLLGKEGLQRTNRTTGNQEVYLVDGSRIVLQPGSSIRHAAFLQKDRREVYLEGNAFFEVAKDADRPFYVYTNDLVVRVLGTSFNVATDQDNGDVTVLVRTGKVSVSKKISARQELVLEPYQQALYKVATRDLIQSAPVRPKGASAIIPVAPAIPFNFEEAPVVEIFKTLEKAYGIPMHYDDKTFSACVVTTFLTNETFEEKLKIICAAIGAAYRIDDTGVVIEGKPCLR